MKPEIKTFGRNNTLCRLCNTHKGVIKKYELKVCRKCFKQRALDLGWFI